METIVLTKGMVDASTGKTLCGVFATTADAQSERADDLALAVIDFETLPQALRDMMSD